MNEIIDALRRRIFQDPYDDDAIIQLSNFLKRTKRRHLDEDIEGRVLNVSVFNLPPEEVARLNEFTDNQIESVLIILSKIEDVNFIAKTIDPDIFREFPEFNRTPTFRSILTYAFKHNFQWVYFSDIAPTLEGFEVLF